MFGPLSFPTPSRKLSKSLQFDTQNEDVTCIMCDDTFTIPKNSSTFFEHLFKEHSLVIADVDHIASLQSYLTYWRIRFADHKIEELCTVLTMDVKSEGMPARNQQYYLLADNLPEEKELREELQKKRLEYVLDEQEKERNDQDFTRECLFCRFQVTTSRFDYLNHLAEQHNLQLGKSTNLVFIDQLLDKIQDKIDRLVCLFCDKTFKDYNVLKEHMRKKQHKRINPDNTEFDRFFVVNYLEMGKSWHHIQNEQDDQEQTILDSDWSDWTTEQPEAPIVCLFCSNSDQSFDNVLRHMTDKHSFKYQEECNNLVLDFYQQVKLVNYIRRQLHCYTCFNCDLIFTDNTLLLEHMTRENHLKIPDASKWNQPEFFFPTYENDSFLCHLEDAVDTSEGKQSTSVA